MIHKTVTVKKILFCVCSVPSRSRIMGAMKMKTLLYGHGGGRNGVPELASRWGAALFGPRREVRKRTAKRLIQFAFDSNSSWRLEGDVRGARIDCRRGRLWVRQAGAAAGVILQPGQSFVSDDEGAIVVQPVPAPADTDEVALGTVTAAAAQLKIHHGQEAVAPTRISMNLARRERTGFWEHLVFIALWLCGLFSVGYCLKTVLWLPWPQ
ncbi:MAG: hypothetical protein DME19_00875 [Verrucomicrobia bacterium]|nr:MAG: hypothetical protein DME19_00875 [Verrucomicrobiota bacterium]